MGRVVVLASSKGGVGKTLVAMLLSARLASEGLRVSAIDADPNGALSDWRRAVWSGADIGLDSEPDAAGLAHLIAERAATADVVVVDTAGFGNQAAAAAIASADAVIVPALSSRADVVEAGRTVRLAEGLARAARRDIAVRVLPNRVEAKTAVARHALGELIEAGLPLLEARLSRAVAYTELTHNGALPTRAPAADEVDRLMRELRATGILPHPPAG